MAHLFCGAHEMRILFVRYWEASATASLNVRANGSPAVFIQIHISWKPDRGY
jgi:hypothetical protein